MILVYKDNSYRRKRMDTTSKVQIQDDAVVV